MKLISVGAAAVLAMLLAACTQGPNGQMETPLGGTKQTLGTLGGAGAGAFIGSQIGHGTGNLAATAIGGLLGAFVGSQVGKSLDRADELAAQQTTQRTLETTPDGQSLPWRNAENGHSGTVTPVRTYQESNGQYCREFQQTVTVGGQTQQAYGTACRQPDGTWKIVQQ
ncbi:MAG TPA: RT0821/Lpp0805 family surface protein [Alphaproteobacteria bacterium]|nr:RT0821/Lpp0805 family surface protein [Alphaproteobacteria bacterium]